MQWEYSIILFCFEVGLKKTVVRRGCKSRMRLQAARMEIMMTGMMKLAGEDGGDDEVGEDGEAGRDDEAGGDGEDKKMDDKERMRDLAPVSLWQGGGEGGRGG